jgi:hypothetical protein
MQEVNTNLYVHMTDAVMEAKSLLRISQTSIHDAELESMANDCVKQVRALNTIIIANATLDVVEGQVMLPKGFQRIIAVRYCDVAGQPIGNYIADFAFMNECGCGINSPFLEGWGGGMMIQSGILSFRDIENAPPRIKISYKSLSLDEDGYILLPERAKLMVMYYLAYRFISMFPRQYETWQYQEFKKEYMAKRDAVISEAARESLTNNFARMVSLTHPVIINL